MKNDKGTSVLTKGVIVHCKDNPRVVMMIIIKRFMHIEFVTASDFFSYLYGISGNDIFTVQGNLRNIPRLSKNRRGGYKILCQKVN